MELVGASQQNRGGAEGDAEERGEKKRRLSSSGASSPRRADAPEDQMLSSAVLRVPPRASAVLWETVALRNDSTIPVRLTGRSPSG